MKLQDIGREFDIGESGVAQASRRAAEQIDKDKKLKRRIKRITDALDLSRMKT